MLYIRTTSNETPLYFMAFESSAKVQFFQILQHSVATFCDISKIVNCMKEEAEESQTDIVVLLLSGVVRLNITKFQPLQKIRGQRLPPPVMPAGQAVGSVCQIVDGDARRRCKNCQHFCNSYETAALSKAYLKAFCRAVLTLRNFVMCAQRLHGRRLATDGQVAPASPVYFSNGGFYAHVHAHPPKKMATISPTAEAFSSAISLSHFFVCALRSHFRAKP